MAKWSVGLSGPTVISVSYLDSVIDSLSLGRDRIWHDDYLALRDRRRRSYKQLEEWYPDKKFDYTE